MPRYFIRLSYKGTGFAGWQIQENALSVQQKVNEVLTLLTGAPVETTGCGRTDSGVHATRFYAHFDVSGVIDNPAKLLYSANAILPGDIVLRELFRVEDTAHARFDASKRTYEYMISTIKNPFMKDLAHHVPFPLDHDAMNEACKLLIGTKDFSCFARTHSGTNNPVCTVSAAYWLRRGDMLVFTITANRFLRNMVRAVVGTMIETGSGKTRPEAMIQLLQSGNRGEAGASAPACGLYLCEVEYPYIVNTGKGSVFDL